MDGVCAWCKIDVGVTLGLIRHGIQGLGRSLVKGVFIGIFTRLQDACEDPSLTLLDKMLGYRRSSVGLACSSHMVTTNGGDSEDVYSLR